LDRKPVHGGRFDGTAFMVSVVVSVGHDNGPFRGSGVRVGCAISASKYGISTDFRVPKGPLISVRSDFNFSLAHCSYVPGRALERR
jgi:hypothetical protein